MDKLTEITTREVNGKMAPDFDTFIWGWGGDPYDPGLLLNLITTKAIGGPRTRSTRTPSTTASTTSSRASSTRPSARRSSSQMIALAQRDLPYIVLTVDPTLQAYRTDKLSSVKRGLPGARRRHHVRPGRLRDVRWRWGRRRRRGGGGGSDDGGSGLTIVLIVVAALVVLGVVVVLLRRRRAGREAVELEQ